MPDQSIGLLSSAKMNAVLSTGPSWWLDNNIDEIISGVYLAAQKEEDPLPYRELANLGIKYVLELLDDPLFSLAPPRVPQGIKYLPIALRNSPMSNIIRLLDQTSAFIREGLSRKFNVLVCSTHGNSRSASIVAGYLMERLNIGAIQAIFSVHSRRLSINPIEGFRDQLLEYEPILQARHLIIMGASSSSYQMRPKRPRQSDESSSSTGDMKRRPMEMEMEMMS